MSGFMVGLLFGFLLKRSRLCFVGNLRDIYVEKRATGIYIVLTVILVQSVIYFSLVKAGVIAGVQYKSFSLLAVMVGSAMFGLGCILAYGCITLSLVKTGDGRLAGVMSLLSFAIFSTSARQGFLKDVTAKIQTIAPINDVLITSLPFSIFLIIVPSLLIVLYLSLKDFQRNQLVFKLPAQYTGVRHLFFEKIWDARFAAVLLGIIAGVAWYLNGALGITGNIVSWLNFSVNGNSSAIGWGSYFVIGIIAGSFICTAGSLEFSFKGTDGRTLVSSLLGGLLMGIGSVWAQGCIVGNGLVGTATFSLKAWCGLIFITFGIWLGAYFYYVRPFKVLRNS